MRLNQVHRSTCTFDDSPHEECGVFGVSTPHGEGVAQTVFFGLFALQHRGQEAAGIAVSDGSRVRMHKDSGLVANVFTPATMATLTGYHGIGHTRYSTTGADAERNIQPFLVETMHGPLAVAHNGNLVNAPALREELLSRGFGLDRHQRHRGAHPDARRRRRADVGGPRRAHPAGVEGRLLAGHPRRRPGDRGARSVGVPADARRPAAPRRLRRRLRDVCAQHARLRRDQRGRPRRDRHAAGRRDAPPPGAHPGGARRRGARSSSSTSPAPTACGPAATSTTSASASARSWPTSRGCRADVVIPVPDSSIPAAIGYSRASGIPHNDGLIKNRYIGRTFIEPTQDLRDRGVALKFNALAENLAGKRVVMIDDSLVRGTTAGPLVRLLREAGATEVHVRITCPPITHAVPLRRRHGPRRRPDGRPPDGRGDARPHRRRLAGLPVARRDDAGDHRRRRQATPRLLQRVLHRRVPDGGRRGPAKLAFEGVLS